MIDVPRPEDDYLDSPEVLDTPEIVADPVPARPRTGKLAKKNSRSSGTTGFGWAMFLRTFRKFGETDGRANRTEYWNFFAFNFVCLFGMGFLMGLLGDANKDSVNIVEGVIAFLIIVYFLAAIAPSIAVAVRRLHDLDRSGWWFLVHFIPFVGGLIFLLFAVSPGTPGKNQYGPKPR